MEELQSNLYVDDWLTGANTEEEVCSLFLQASNIMCKAGMELTKWNSSLGLVKETVLDKLGCQHLKETNPKVVGVKWIPSEDCFSFVGIAIPLYTVVTKWVFLSCIARTYDPLGFITPFVMSAKILFQDVWKLGLDWDDPLPSDLTTVFMDWLSGLSVLKG